MEEKDPSSYYWRVALPCIWGTEEKYIWYYCISSWNIIICGLFQFNPLSLTLQGQDTHQFSLVIHDESHHNLGFVKVTQSGGAWISERKTFQPLLEFITHRILRTGIFTYIWIQFTVNVRKYTIHRSYGLNTIFWFQGWFLASESWASWRHSIFIWPTCLYSSMLSWKKVNETKHIRTQIGGQFDGDESHGIPIGKKYTKKTKNKTHPSCCIREIPSNYHTYF